jgi:hypothetical protein
LGDDLKNVKQVSQRLIFKAQGIPQYAFLAHFFRDNVPLMKLKRFKYILAILKAKIVKSAQKKEYSRLPFFVQTPPTMN